MTTLPTDFEVVRATPLAEELDTQECQALARIIEHHRLADGEVLIDEGTTDDMLHVIISGRLVVVRKTGNDDEVTLHAYRQGEMVGELGFIDGTAHCATVRADGVAEVFSLHRDAFESMVGEHPRTAHKVMKAVVRTVHTIVRRMNLQYVEMTNYITQQHGKY